MTRINLTDSGDIKNHIVPVENLVLTEHDTIKRNLSIHIEI